MVIFSFGCVSALKCSPPAKFAIVLALFSAFILDQLALCGTCLFDCLWASIRALVHLALLAMFIVIFKSTHQPALKYIKHRKFLFPRKRIKNLEGFQGTKCFKHTLQSLIYLWCGCKRIDRVGNRHWNTFIIPNL